ncbi:MAG: DUF1549 domain-containing protein [Phycisphaeraceae bacterium]|nr:DUF1549 domain-containing protein [Phycisphaeraceae bacterium]
MPPVRSDPPPPSNPAWPRRPLDNWVLASLTDAGLEPSPEADRRTLIRRVSLDLIGLPPTTEETDAFVNDASPDAYERVVDRLLASPRFGEKWAAGGSISHATPTPRAYEKDDRRTMWPIGTGSSGSERRHPLRPFLPPPTRRRSPNRTDNR